MSIESIYPYERDIYIEMLRDSMKTVEERPAMPEAEMMKLMAERRMKKKNG